MFEQYKWYNKSDATPIVLLFQEIASDPARIRQHYRRTMASRRNRSGSAYTAEELAVLNNFVNAQTEKLVASGQFGSIAQAQFNRWRHNINVFLFNSLEELDISLKEHPVLKYLRTAMNLSDGVALPRNPNNHHFSDQSSSSSSSAAENGPESSSSQHQSRPSPGMYKHLN